MTKVLIADDHTIVRTGLRALLQAETTLEIVGEATGGYEAIQLVDELMPDILVLDISMPDLDGISVTRQLHPTYPDLKILILTLHEDKAMLREAIKSGASGYILKKAAETELISAIQIVMRGDMYVEPSMLRDLLKEQPKLLNNSHEPVETLTPREVDVLKLIVQGYTNRQIGEELGISVRTVEGHRANLTGKLGLRSRVELVRYAREQGLLE
ncbi:MAG: response regulator transcription factor [Anaerolineales bacterium]|jgi:two-component system response regulator NreC